MTLKLTSTCAALAAAALLAACGERSRLPDAADVGPRPVLLPPNKTLMPTVNVAPAVGWQGAGMPVAAAGTQVTPFATGLEHPRWILVLPNGDVLVAETNAPPKPDDGNGIKGFFMKTFMKRAGAGTPSANRITLLRDADGDGRAETKSVFIEGLNSPFGMTLVGDKLYVANTDGIVEFDYAPGATAIAGPGRKVADLPGGTLNHHWTKNVVASADGSKLYASVGSNSNVAENGVDAEQGRAAIWEIDRATGATRPYATGLRNPNGMAWVGSTLWTVVNERDEIGSDLVPDYLTSVRDGAFYGWPYVWYGSHVDERVAVPAGTTVPQATVPDYALGAHVAALGLAAGAGSALAQRIDPGAAQGVFIGLHGSWNRRPLSGYKVVYVPFGDGRPVGTPKDVLTGFVDGDGNARGRPVGVAVDGRGGLLVADDVGNAIWRVVAAP